MGAVLIGGCEQSKNGGNPLVQGAAPRGTPEDPSSVVARKGTAPMRYLLAGGGNVRVIDLTDDKVIAHAVVGPQTAVTIDPTSGVSFGNNNVVKGPLPSGHQYAIKIDR